MYVITILLQIYTIQAPIPLPTLFVSSLLFLLVTKVIGRFNKSKLFFFVVVVACIEVIHKQKVKLTMYIMHKNMR